MDFPLDPSAFAGPLVVTLLYVGLYYAFQVNILRVKTALQREAAAKGEKFDRYFGQDRRMLAADRIQLNMLEHMPPFLILLWLNAVFVGGISTTIVGGIYVASRALYPFLVGSRLGRSVKAQIVVATGPGYGVIAWYVGALVWAMVA